MRKNSNQGLALAIVLVLMLLVSLAGSGMLILSNSHYKLTQHLIDSTKALYLAEAGIHRGLYIMRNFDPPLPETFPFGPIPTNVNITFVGNPAPLIYTITATTDPATSPGNVSRIIRVDATREVNLTPPPLYNITSVTNWQEL